VSPLRWQWRGPASLRVRPRHAIRQNRSRLPVLSVADAVVLSVSFFPPNRVGEALHAFYPLAVPAAPRDPPDLAVVFDCLAGPAEAAPALARARRRAARALASAREHGIVPVCWSNPGYPPLLAAIPDPPPVLWLAGRPEALLQPHIAIVGARNASPYGLECAGTLAIALAGRGFGVVSGLARGIDAASHRGALKAGGVTVAVLGSGTDVVYPAEHRALAREVVTRGAVVSELPPGSPPRAFHFPRRNRIISGLASGVVVIEASAKSGALITADAALEQGREVMAVPGNVLTGRNRGGNGLIKDGAALIEDIDDVLAALGQWAAIGPPRAVEGAEERDRLLAAMVEEEPYDIDQLAQASGFPPPTLLSRLLALELGGLVRREGGGRFVRVRRSC
jgi:DNA processing protein